MVRAARLLPGLDVVRLRSPVLHALLLALVALIARVAPIWRNGFDGLYGQDAYSYFSYAQGMTDALAYAQLPSIFHKPLGYPLLLTTGFALFGKSIAAAQWTTLLSGIAAALFTFLLARELAPEDDKWIAGLVAGLALALSGQVVQSSIVVMSDAPTLMWSAASAWLLVRYLHHRRAVELGLSALCLGLALITRWETLGLAAGWGAAFLLGARRAGQTASEWARDALVVCAVLAIVLVPDVYYEFMRGSQPAGGSWVESWSPANALARSFDNVDGHFQYALPPALFYAQPLFHPAYLFPLLTPFTLIGAWLMTRRAGDHARAPAAVLFALWVGITFLFLAGIPYENFRFGLALFIPIVVLTGLGVGWAWSNWANGKRWRQGALVSILTVGFAGFVFWQPRVLHPIVEGKAVQLAQAQSLSRIVPPGAVVYTFAVTGALETYAHLPTADVWSDPLETIRARARAVPAFLFLDTGNVETQWRGFRVEDNYHALRDNGELKQVAVIEGWSLFEIRTKD